MTKNNIQQRSIWADADGTVEQNHQTQNNLVWVHHKTVK